MKKIRVNLDRKSANAHEIFIGRGIIDRMGLLMAKNNWASRYVLVTDSRVAELHGDRVLATLRGMNLAVDMIQFPAGEASKTVRTCLDLVERLLALGADRKSALIALGGGVVGDLTGLAASLFMRGIPYLQAPTTLLAQVDSAIGGKTGVNLPMAKNMLGTFYQPRGVFIDLAFLDTLPEREFANGLAEIVKYGVIEDPELLKHLADEAEAIRGRDGAILERLVARSCRIKKGIVELDETEKGLRRILNFGHTMGHAVEAATDYGMAHGEAVAVGMVAAARISVALDHLSADEGERIEAVLRAVGLPVRIPGNVSAERLLDGLRMDKKKEGADVHFVLLKKIGIPFVNGGVPEALLRKTIEDLQS